MKRIFIIAAACIFCLASPTASAQATTQTALGVNASEMGEVNGGWSIKKDLLGKNVVNEQKEKIGKVDDIVVTRDSGVSYAVIGVGGFLGIAKNDVAIPMKQLKVQGGDLILSGATKDALKALPKYDYVRK